MKPIDSTKTIFRQQLCTFNLGDLYLGIDVGLVQEVIRFQPMTRVPLAATEVCGLINLRGQIVTAIDLRQRFALSNRSKEITPVNVIISSEDGPMSLLVDEIEDVMEVYQDTFEPLPDTLLGPIRTAVSGIHKLNDRLLLRLNAERLISSI